MNKLEKSELKCDNLLKQVNDLEFKLNQKKKLYFKSVKKYVKLQSFKVLKIK